VEARVSPAPAMSHEIGAPPELKAKIDAWRASEG
jgi:hypothetical protein